MKIGVDPRILRPEIHLPTEIINSIVDFLSSDLAGRETLWACSIVSRQWYSASISRLYEHPRLTARNCDGFAATICPPVNAHIRHVDLGDHVKYLDMGALAYDSSRSLTARLLRRVGRNLETFIAPVTSFSRNSLAPLSKCEKLQFLDLSHSIYSMSVIELLRSLSKLMRLNVLCLPPLAYMMDKEENVDLSLGHAEDHIFIKWPPNLIELHLSNEIPSQLRSWQRLSRSWPKSLTSLTIRDCRSFAALSSLSNSQVKYSQIQSLCVTAMTQRSDPLGIHDLMMLFPSLRFLSVPAKAADITGSASGLKAIASVVSLEQLELTSGGKVKDIRNFYTRRLLSYLALNLPRLWQLRLSDAYLEFDNVWADSQDVDALLKQRVLEWNASALCTLYDPEDAGLELIEHGARY